MHVKVSCKGIDTEADLSVLIHANLIFQAQKMSRQCWNKQVSGSFSNYGEQPRVVLKVTIKKLTGEDQYRIMILIAV